MKIKLVWAAAFLIVLAAPVFAQDPFDVGYRQEDVAVEGNTVTGKLLVSVYNVSGADVRDAAVSIPGPNNVTYDNRTIFIGDLKDGQRVEILDPFSVPLEMKQTDGVDDQAAMNFEFTTATGERKKSGITGRNVQIKNQ